MSMKIFRIRISPRSQRRSDVLKWFLKVELILRILQRIIFNIFGRTREEVLVLGVYGFSR